MLSFKLDIKKKYEMWSLVGPEPLRFSLLEFENLTGLNCEYIEDLETPKCDVTPEMVSFGDAGSSSEAGPTTAARVLSIFTGFIEGRQFSTSTRSTLVWTHTAMPELGASIGGPRADSPSPPILAYEGSRGRRSMKAAIQTRVINFVEKDISEMWPKWDSEVEDLPAENIIKVMYERRPWKWTMDCWEVTGTKVNTKPKGGASNFYDGSIPSFCQSNKKWGEDIDDIYAPVNLDDKHWVAIWISIPKRHIVVWDSIPSSSVLDAWDAIMEPFLQMVPYLLVECAATDEIRVKYGLEPYTYERPLKGVPTANNGDCGVYAVKYIECHALGVSFDPKDFARCNAKKMRDNMAVDIWKELVDQHLKENVDGDKFVGMYD
ncbi:hypothetical protein Bca101_101941 [Brassica carinata]